MEKTRKLHVKHRYRRPHVKNGVKKEVFKCPSRALPEAGAGDERESRLLPVNPPPGSTDPERFATVSIGIGDRVSPCPPGTQTRMV